MILNHLKTQTANLHKETEEENLAKYILDHSITVEQYRLLLRQNFYAYYELEHVLAQNKEHVPDGLRFFVDSTKTLALTRDLRQLNSNPEISIVRAKTLNAFEILGLLYVVEGSMLGGLLMRKNLDACKCLPAGLEHHFFGKKPEEVMQRWKAFTAAVNEEDYAQNQKTHAVDGARYAFKVFKKSYRL